MLARLSRVEHLFLQFMPCLSKPLAKPPLPADSVAVASPTENGAKGPPPRRTRGIVWPDPIRSDGAEAWLPAYARFLTNSVVQLVPEFP